MHNIKCKRSVFCRKIVLLSIFEMSLQVCLGTGYLYPILSCTVFFTFVQRCICSLSIPHTHTHTQNKITYLIAGVLLNVRFPGY